MSVEGICALTVKHISNILSNIVKAGIALELFPLMRSTLFILSILFFSSAEAQVNKGAFRSVRNDTTQYFIRLSSEKPFTIDSVKSVSTGRTLEFYDAKANGKACSSIMCTKPEDVTIGFKERASLSPLSGEKRTALNSHAQPTSDFQKGVIIYTRHGKTFKRIAVETFMETAPGEPDRTPSIPRGAGISGDR
jgi:hypothetical protein